MVGYLLAALTFYLVFTFTHWDWRALFIIGALPAGLILYIRTGVPESEAWLAHRARRITLPPNFLLKSLLTHWPLFIYAVAFMATLNAMSHGTQDLYATFLQKQHGFPTGLTSTLSIVAAVGAILGGIAGGILSERLGRRVIVMLCAAFALAMVPLWAFSSAVVTLAAGAFFMQFAVQGAWGVIPAHLNELSPAETRGTFPGFTYQLGNLLAAGAAQIEATLAQRLPLPGGALNYGGAMALVTAIVLVSVFALAALGYLVKKENRTASFISSPT